MAILEVEGFGEIEIPDDASDEEVNSIVRDLTGENVASEQSGLAPQPETVLAPEATPQFEADMQGPTLVDSGEIPPQSERDFEVGMSDQEITLPGRGEANIFENGTINMPIQIDTEDVATSGAGLTGAGQIPEAAKIRMKKTGDALNEMMNLPPEIVSANLPTESFQNDLKIAAGLLFAASPLQIKDVLQENLPEGTKIDIKKDDSVVVTLPDGRKLLANRPGFSMQDIMSTTAQIAAFLGPSKLAGFGKSVMNKLGFGAFTKIAPGAIVGPTSRAIGAAGTSALLDRGLELAGSKQGIDKERAALAAGFSIGGDAALGFAKMVARGAANYGKVDNIFKAQIAKSIGKSKFNKYQQEFKEGLDEHIKKVGGLNPTKQLIKSLDDHAQKNYDDVIAKLDKLTVRYKADAGPGKDFSEVLDKMLDSAKTGDIKSFPGGARKLHEQLIELKTRVDITKKWSPADMLTLRKLADKDSNMGMLGFADDVKFKGSRDLLRDNLNTLSKDFGVPMEEMNSQIRKSMAASTLLKGVVDEEAIDKTAAVLFNIENSEAIRNGLIEAVERSGPLTTQVKNSAFGKIANVFDSSQYRVAMARFINQHKNKAFIKKLRTSAITGVFSRKMVKTLETMSKAAVQSTIRQANLSTKKLRSLSEEVGDDITNFFSPQPPSGIPQTGQPGQFQGQ